MKYVLIFVLLMQAIPALALTNSDRATYMAGEIMFTKLFSPRNMQLIDARLGRGMLMHYGSAFPVTIQTRTDLLNFVATELAGVQAGLMTFGPATYVATYADKKQVAVKGQIDKFLRKGRLAKSRMLWPDYTSETINDGYELAKETLMMHWHLFAAIRDYLQVNSSIGPKALDAIFIAAEELNPKMSKLVQSGWTREKAEKIKVDIEEIQQLYGCEVDLTPESRIPGIEI